jgi:hypothetical protein
MTYYIDDVQHTTYMTYYINDIWHINTT